MQWNRETLKQIRGLIIFTLFLLVLLWNYRLLYQGIFILWEIISPFMWGICIAFVIDLPTKFFETHLFCRFKKRARVAGLVITLLLGFLLIFAVLFYMVPQLGKTIAHLGENMDIFLPKLQRRFVEIVEGEPRVASWIAGLNLEWHKISEYLVRFIRNGSSSYELGMKTVMSMVQWITKGTIGFAFACYVVLEKERLFIQGKKVLYAFFPEDWVNILLALLAVVQDSFSKFLTGQCLEGILLGGIFLILLLVFQIPYALLLSFVIAVTSIIPIFGAFMGCGIGLLLIFTESPGKTLLFLILFLVVQQLEGDILYPRVVGRSVGLPAIWVLFSVSVGAGLFGIVGMLLFIPLFSVFYSLLKGVVHRRLRRRGVEIE